MNLHFLTHLSTCRIFAKQFKMFPAAQRMSDHGVREKACPWKADKDYNNVTKLESFGVFRTWRC